MEGDKQQLESLHQQASALYLQGEYVGALEAWSRLLELDPSDERAREGLRLCELLVEEEGGTVPPRPAREASGAGSSAAAGTAQSTPAVGMGIGEDLDEELDELDEMLAGGTGKDWMDEPAAAAGAPQAEASTPAPNAEIDFDLTEVPSQSAAPAAESASARPADSAPSGAGLDFNFEGTDQQATVDAVDSAFDFTAAETEPAQPPPAELQTGTPAPGAAAESARTSRMAVEELQNRINELMAEALEHYEQGDREGALGALARLQILDESNEAARTFADHIRSELEPARQAPVPPEFESAQGGPASSPQPDAAPSTHPSLPTVDAAQNHEPLDLGTGSEVAGLGVDPAPAPTSPGKQQVGQTTTDLDPFRDDPLLADVVSSAEADAPPPPPAADRTSSALPTRWLLIAAVGLVVVGGAFLALQLFGGGLADSVEGGSQSLGSPPPLTPGTDVGNPPPPQGGVATDTAQTDPPVQSPTAAPPDAAELDEILDRGDRAFESGDFAAAVLAYNEALKLDPQNEVAKRNLQEAGDLYREQKESLAQRAQAIQAFNDGDYRNALRLFYRIKPVDDVERERFLRYRLNGWFNMGLRALKAGDCRLARTHLKEAQSVDPLDRGLQGAMDMTALCFEGHTQSYFDAVRSLRFRGLED